MEILNKSGTDPDDFIAPFSPDQKERYVEGVYTKSITSHKLDLRYHSKVAGTLEEAMSRGFGSRTPVSRGLVKKLQSNIYVFSAAKQYQQVRIMSEFINTRGTRSTFAEFKKLADKVFVEYNENYLRTEWVTAIGQSQMAREWMEIEETADLFPVLEYRTQRDAHVRDAHAALDGVTLPVNHPFWNRFMPKNGWNCRCFTVSHEKKRLTNLESMDLRELNDRSKFPDEFKMNPGKDGYIFHPKKHPYFSVARRDNDLKKENFKLPVP